MGREIKRVPLDFDWPLDKVWEGYLSPDSLDETPCPDCEQTGYAPRARELQALWYGREGGFRPENTGSTPLAEDTPEVRAFAERNIDHAPDYYGSGEAAIRREARRLSSLWNGMWSHHLAQPDVDALIAGGRLRDFTHTFSRETRWTPREPIPTVTAADVNLWSLSSLGHDAINCGIVIRARCEREGAPVSCAGHGSTEAYPGQRADADNWQATEPPTGEGWQVWETVSEGSPITPVFPTAETLIDHLSTVGTVWDVRRGDGPWRRSAAEAFVQTGWAATFTQQGDGPLLVGGRDADRQ